MFKKNVALWLCFALSLAACGGGDGDSTTPVNPAEFQTRSLAHDKAYIPPLYYADVSAASEQAVADAKAALAVYQPLWTDLQGYYAKISKTASSSAYLQKAGEFLSDAGNFILNAWNELTADLRDSVDLSGVHAQMESLRQNLKAWRKDNQLTYFMDDLTTFHTAVKPLAERVQALADPSQLTAEHLAALANDLSALEPAWTVIKTVTPEILQAQYQFKKAKALAVYQFIQSESGNLAELSLALASGDRARALTTAQRILPAFLQTLLAFGDFLTPFAPDMISMERHYIPLLLLTQSATADAATYQQAQTALVAFMQAWQLFAAHYANNQTALNWQTQFAAVEMALAEAQTLLAAQSAPLNSTGSANLLSAFDKLNRIRDTLAALRSYENYPFVMDSVTGYYHAMQPMVAALANNSKDFNALMPLLSQAQSAAQGLSEAIHTMDAAQFGFDVAKMTAIKTAAQQQISHLETLSQAISSGDAAAAASAGGQLEPLFTALFREFGAF